MKKLKYLLLLLFLIGIFQNAALAQCDKVSFSHDGEKIYVRNNGLAGLKEIKIIGRTRDANKPIEIGDIPDLMEHIKDGKRIPIILILDKEYDCSQVIKKSTSNQNKNNTTNTNKEQITEIEVKIEKPVIKISLVKDSTENDEIAITYSIENFDNHYLKLPDGSIHKLDKPKGEIQFLKELIEGQNILVFELLNSSENSYNPKVETSVIIIYRPKPVELTSTEKNLKNFKDNIIFIAVGIFILLLIVTVLLVTKSKKKQEVVKKPVKSNSGIVIGQKSSSQTSTQNQV